MTPTDREFAADRARRAEGIRDRARVVAETLGITDPEAIEVIVAALQAQNDGACEGCTYRMEEGF